MGSPPQNSDLTFPQADVAGELNPGTNTHVHVDSVSSELAASKVYISSYFHFHIQVSA